MTPDDRRSAAEFLGPHLLGRKPMPPDDRDYQLEDYVHASDAATELSPDTTIQELIDGGWVTSWHGILAFWRWIKSLIIGQPKPPPGETWVDPEQGTLDQGQTPHCVGFTGAGWMSTLPVHDQVENETGHDLYAACKVLDGEPGAEDGSNSRSLCKVLKTRGRIGAYAFTTDAQTVADFVSAHGPVGTGTPWDQSMFNPDGDGYLRPNGDEAGGHEWLIVGYSPAGFGNVQEPSFVMQNSWGTGWGDNGRAYITSHDYQSLLDRNGDAWAGVELPL
jgi:Papain family cysteine protease